ncbi:MAG: hypothetical protein FWF85_02090, partial [Clostridiales bacterium]|nr:hypothetical protein [Clostridiales bacterium]
SPESVADLWGQAMTTRNGALVYALYLDDSEEKPRHDRSDSSIWETGWHMGGSNPHFVRYKVSTKTTNADGTISIEVILSSELSGADPIDDTITLNLVKIDENGWYIVSEVW